MQVMYRNDLTKDLTSFVSLAIHMAEQFHCLTIAKKSEINRIPAETTFLAFCRHLEEQGCDPIGLYNSTGLSQCNPQASWIRNVDIDYIGRVETIEDDLRRILATLNLPDTNVPHLNTSSNRDFREFFCKETEQIVDKIYDVDFTTFGYSKGVFNDGKL